MDSKIVTRIILAGIGVERLGNRAFSLMTTEASGFITWGLKVRIQKLASNLEKIQSLLLDAERKGASSEFVRVWMKRVAVVSSEIDILLDECEYENLRLKSEKEDKYKKSEKVLVSFFTPSNTVVVRAKMISRFNGINSKLEKLFCNSLMLELIQLNNNAVNSRVEREEFSQTLDSSLVESFAMTGDLKCVKDLLIDSFNDRDLSVISILGKEGIEKTNLAKSVYHDVDVLEKFKVKLWIDVFNEVDVFGILKQMFEQLTETTSSLSSREALIYALVDKLKGSKFLLVLDDVHYKDGLKWSSFIKCLQKVVGSKGSKVLVTSGDSQLTMVVQAFHELRGQGSSCTPNLFSKLGFGRQDGATKTSGMVKMGEGVVTRCGDTRPLLTKLMVSFMYSRKDDEVCYRVPDVPGEQMLDMMKLCYDRLPSWPLRQCFAYSCVFPKGSVIEEAELLQFWMAHGLLYPPKSGSDSIEDIGKGYLKDLVRHSFLLEVADDERRNLKCFRMPHLLHDLATLASSGLCSIMENVDVEDDFKAVHVTMIKCKVQLSKRLRRAIEKLRTLRLVDARVSLEYFLQHTRCLCALTVVNSQVKTLPGSIGMLRHLKLLDISRTRIVNLPDSITELYGLQTLRLHDLQELPKDFEKLDNLVHFYIENFVDLTEKSFLPPKFRDLIKRSSSKAHFKACLGNKLSLETLGSLDYPDRYSSLMIYRLENVKDREEAAKADLPRMTGIDTLKLHWNERRENSVDESVLEGLKPHCNIRNLLIENFKGSRFPSWMVTTSQPSLTLHNLVRVELEDCSWCEQVPPLGHLHRLKLVRIRGMENVKSIGSEFYGFEFFAGASASSFRIFPALIELILVGMTSLEVWSEPKHQSYESSSAFPFLERLEVESCPKLKSLPDILGPDHNGLGRLKIAMCDRLTSVPTLLQNLESALKDLDIRVLPSLAQLSLKCCNNLTSLTIGGFSSASDAETSSASLDQKPGIASLPEELKHLSSLEHLTIWGYDKMQALPEWLARFQSLQSLNIELCRNLKYFPSADAMRKLAKLEDLKISFCPLLEERCTRGSRLEWPKISHISRILINYETIKFEK